MAEREVIRSGLYLRALMQVLRDAGEPLPGREAVDRVGRRIEPSDYEAGAVPSGEVRWRNNIQWYSGDAATIGWLTKRDGLWWLTDAGVAAVESYDDAEQLLASLRRGFQEIQRRRREAIGVLGENSPVLAGLLAAVPAGCWTSHDDLAEILKTSAEIVSAYLAGSRAALPGGYRVLTGDGTVPPDGLLHVNHRGMDIVRKLESEGVQFLDGHASPSQRVTADDLRARVAGTPPPEPIEQSPARRAWLVRGSSVDGVDLVQVWLDSQAVSLAATSLRPVFPPVSLRELRRFVEEDYQSWSYPVRNVRVHEFDAFCNRMRPGDYLLTTTGDDAFVGRITGDAVYVRSDDQRSNLRREAEWLNVGRPLRRSDLPQPLSAKLASQSDVVELTEGVALVESLLTRRLEVEVPTPAPAPARPLAFRPVTDDLASALLIDRAWLQEQADLLWEYKQVILHGPPGTGKTYLARGLARHLAEPSAVTLVQFHPSYTYEDFFEGFRPVQQDDGHLSFDLRPGPFRRLVEDARQHPSDPYVLVIDEINRANLAKVFGELYFLLEYRDDAVELLYSAEADFTLPANVFLIGTMNTADRSIAHLDAAMRRRFAFVEMHPSAPPTAGLLAAWLDRLGSPEDYPHNRDAPALLDLLNGRIGDRDLAIGPSYLMRATVYTREDGLERVWRNSVLPLLAEHHYGNPAALDSYALPALRAALPADTGAA